MAPPPHESTLPAFSSDCTRRAKGAAACDSFTRNLTIAEKEELNTRCAQALEGKEHFVATVADALNSAEGHFALPDELERTNEMYACGFEVMKQGLITDGQFASLCLFENTKQHDENATVMSLFHSDDSRNEEAIDLVRNTFRELDDCRFDYAFLTRKEEEQFLDIVKKLPASERQFVVYDVPSPGKKVKHSPLYAILLHLLQLPFLSEKPRVIEPVSRTSAKSSHSLPINATDGESHAFYVDLGYFGDIRKAAYWFLRVKLSSMHCSQIQIFMRLCRRPGTCIAKKNHAIVWDDGSIA